MMLEGEVSCTHSGRRWAEAPGTGDDGRCGDKGRTPATARGRSCQSRPLAAISARLIEPLIGWMSVKMASSTLHPGAIKGANQPVETISGYIPDDPQKDKQLVY